MGNKVGKSFPGDWEKRKCLKLVLDFLFPLQASLLGLHVGWASTKSPPSAALFAARRTNADVELFCPACSSPQVGFLRFLNLLAAFDWKNNPLIVNLNTGLTGEQAAARRAAT